MIELAAYIRDIPDFPKPGITFKDVIPLLADGAVVILIEPGFLGARSRWPVAFHYMLCCSFNLCLQIDVYTS